MPLLLQDLTESLPIPATCLEVPIRPHLLPCLTPRCALPSFGDQVRAALILTYPPPSRVGYFSPGPPPSPLSQERRVPSSLAFFGTGIK